MGFFQDFKRLFIVDEVEQRGSLQNPSSWMYTLLGGSKTSAGVTVNQESALAFAAVYACCKILSESIASLPLELYFSDGNETRVLSNDSRHRLLGFEPSPLYSAYDFRLTAMMHVCLNGNFYAWIKRDGNRRPLEFQILESNSVTPGLDPEGNLWYKVSGVKGIDLPLRPKDILHFKAPGTNGLVGKSPIELFKQTIGLGIATTETQGSLWKNGMITQGYLKHPQKMTADQVSDIRENFSKNFSGKDNAGKMPVLQNGMEFIQLSLKPSDALFIETAKLTARDIYAIYRVPPHLVGDLERSTNNNIEHQSAEFVRYTLRPLTKGIEQELDRKLLFDGEVGSKYFRHNMDSLLRGDTQARGEYYTRALGSVSSPGWMTQNEVRALENLNPNPEGDTLYNPTMNKDAAADKNPDAQNDNSNDNNDQQPDAAK